MRAADQARLAARFLWAAPGRSAALALGLAVAGVLPLGTAGVAQVLRVRAQARIDGAPVVWLAPGDPRGPLVSALAFVGPAPPPLAFDSLARAAPDFEGDAWAVRTGRRVQGAPLVGVDAGWLAAWGLSVAEGRAAALPGEVVVGQGAAARLGLAVGDTVQADPEGAVSLETVPPMPLTIVGQLQATPLPEDGALLTSLETTWMLDGALHGDAQALHLHGSVGGQPVSAIVARPAHPRDRDLLLVAADGADPAQAARPAVQARALFDALAPAIHTARLWGAVGATAVLALMGALLTLGQRARARDLLLIAELGGGPRLLRALLAWELGLLLAAATLLSAAVLAASGALLGLA